MINPKFWAIPVLVVLGTLMYSNTLHAPYVYDDMASIVSNENVHPGNLGMVFRAYDPEAPFKRPVAYISFALNYYLWGPDVIGFHLINTAIHILTGIGVYLLVKFTLEISGEKSQRSLLWVPSLAAIIWLASPVQTQAVTYIVQRMTSMAALFYIYALLFYIKGRRGAALWRVAHLSISVLLFILSAGTKQNSLTLPLTLVLYEFCFFRFHFESKRRFYLSLIFTVLIALGLLLFSPYLEPKKYLLLGYVMNERIFTEARVITNYVGLMLFPIPSRLVFLYDFPFSKGILSPPSTLLSLIALTCGMIASVLMITRKAFVSFFLLWFFINILPESLYLNIEPVFEHRLYLPSVGFYAVMAYIFIKMTEMAIADMKARMALIGIILIVPILFSINTYRRNMDWSDEISFWTDNVKKAPMIPDTHEGLGTAYLSAGRLDEAEKELNTAKSLDPLSRASLTLGLVYFKRGDYMRTIEEFEYVLRRKSLGVDLRYFDTDAVFYSMGIEFLKIGRPWDAAKILRMGRELNPGNLKIKDALTRLERGS